MKTTKFNTEIFIQKSKEKHGEKYNYSLVDYKTADNKVIIICPKHGIFEQLAYSHYSGVGCKKCSDEKKGFSLRKNTEDFIIQANIIHNNKYNYLPSKYIRAHNKLKIVCPKHGEFEQSPDNHLHGKGCKKCQIENTKKNLTLTNENFIQRASLIHDNYFNYDLCMYEHNNKKVKITCPKHGMFEQTPDNHLHGKGCKKCSSSKGEIIIRKLLNELDIKFYEQKTFDCCKSVNLLPFDFYLKEFNVCIEYDGIQHFKSVEFFGGVKRFNERIKNDKIKTEYCIKNNIRLIRIKYSDKIEIKIKELFPKLA